ncbi:MAG: CBS domain-containing protein [Proteobacteria bacterium]|nr:CBS domain-containing protein [Pseudomonadota bacterium]
MILEDALDFLQGTPPFQFLQAEHLKRAASELSLEFYPRGTVVLKQNGPPSDCLRIIKKGSVQVLMDAEDGDQLLLEVKGEGDNFGFLSMIGKDRQRTTVKVVEDALCYILSQNQVRQLLEVSQPFSEYFMAYLSRYVDRTYQEMHHRSSFYGSSDRLLFTTRVGDIAIPHITISENATIQEAAQIMAQNKISSLVLEKENNLPSGIITIRDLRDKVVAKGRDVLEPVKNIGSISLIRADGRDTCFTALLKMIQFNIHHLPVVEDGELKGIVTNHDIMLLQGTSPVSFANDIINQQTVEGLIPLTGKIFNIIGLLLKEETQFFHLSNIITEIYDRLFRKILEIGEKKFGPPPLPYCLVALGSEGRREHIFKIFQHYVLIYSDPLNAEVEREATEYFSNFHFFFRDSLMALGAPPISDNGKLAMPRWHHPCGEWETVFKEWISHPSEDNTTSILPFFDARPFAGKIMLFQASRNWVTPLLLEGRRDFLKMIALLATNPPPPVGFAKNMVIERDGSQQETLDLYQRGLLPIINLVRLFALFMGVRESSTLGRIRALQIKDATFGNLARELRQSFEFMKLLQIHHQFQQIKMGLPSDSILHPDQLSSLEKKTLRESFRIIADLQTKASTFIK